MDNITRQLQITELNILKEVVRVCDELGIKYYLTYGSLLGAVRHKGFIPWDDDIDINMLRDDYDVFIDKGPELLNNNYMIQHFSTDYGTNNIFAKVRDTNTLFIENDTQNLEMNHGVFIDVFPIERVHKGLLDGRAEYMRRKIFNLINGCYDMPYVESIQSSFKRSVAMFIHKNICIRQDRHDFIAKEDERRLKLHRNNGGYYFIGYFDYYGLDKYINLDSPIKYDFEDVSLWGPKHADFILTKIYGDYMKLPPIEKRVTHKPLKIVFDLKNYKED